MGSLGDSIFPQGAPGNGYELRLGYVGSWESQFIGVGRLTAFLTPRLLAESHAFDDMGLNVVFLQRHRVEVGLKLILERANAEVEITHSIHKLMVACARACDSAGFAKYWTTHFEAQREFIELMHSADPDASRYRFPVGRDLRPLTRGPVDLRELELAGSSFQRSTLALVGELARLECPPVEEDEAMETAQELQALIHGCHEMMRGARHNRDEMQKQTRALGLPPDQSSRAFKANIAMDSVGEVAEALAERTHQMLDRLIATYELPRPDEPANARLLPIPPQIPLRSAKEMHFAQDKLIDAIVENIRVTMRPLALATNAVFKRSRSWSGPAAKQLHLDVALFRSRLSIAKAI